jgi:hypothetical protein
MLVHPADDHRMLANRTDVWILSHAAKGQTGGGAGSVGESPSHPIRRHDDRAPKGEHLR